MDEMQPVVLESKRFDSEEKLETFTVSDVFCR